MKNKGLILILIALLLLVIGFVVMRQKVEAPAPEGQLATTTTESNTMRTFSWRFETEESNDGMAPRTKVALITGGNAYDAGAYPGTCAKIAAENLLPNEVSGVLCWFAGGGDELGVFKEGDQYVLKHGVQDEGTAETDGFRGDFQQMAVIQ